MAQGGGWWMTLRCAVIRLKVARPILFSRQLSDSRLHMQPTVLANQAVSPIQKHVHGNAGSHGRRGWLRQGKSHGGRDCSGPVEGKGHGRLEWLRWGKRHGRQQGCLQEVFSFPLILHLFSPLRCNVHLLYTLLIIIVYIIIVMISSHHNLQCCYSIIIVQSNWEGRGKENLVTLLFAYECNGKVKGALLRVLGSSS